MSDDKLPFVERRRDDSEFDDQQQQRWDAFNLEEGPGEDLPRMFLKLGRRSMAHKAHVVGRLSEQRDHFKKKLLVRALGSEERYQFAMRRDESARSRASEYMSKALALGLDRLCNFLEVQRGYFDYCVDRVKSRVDGLERITALLERVAGMGDDDIQHSTVKSIALGELVKDMIRSQDGLVDKLGMEDQRKLYQFITGMSADPPEFLEPLLRDFKRDRPIPRGTPAGDPKTALITIDLKHFDTSSYSREDWEEDPGKHSLTPERFTFRNDSFEDKEIEFYVDSCISVAEPDWAARGGVPWPDTRFPANVAIERTANWVAQEPEEIRERQPRKLAMLGSIEGEVRVFWSPWFEAHDRQLYEFMQELVEIKKARWYQIQDLVRSLPPVAGEITQMPEKPQCRDWPDGFPVPDPRTQERDALCKEQADLQWQIHQLKNGLEERCRFYRIDVRVPAVGKTLRLKFAVHWKGGTHLACPPPPTPSGGHAGPGKCESSPPPGDRDCISDECEFPPVPGEPVPRPEPMALPEDPCDT